MIVVWRTLKSVLFGRLLPK